LESGDVLTQINGVAVTSPAEAFAALHTLMEGAVLTVLVERHGSSQALSLDGSVFMAANAPQQKNVELGKPE